MSTHYLLRLLVPALALVGCTQGAPSAPGDPSNPGDPQQPQGSNPPQLRYDQPLVYGHSGAPWITDLDGDGHLDMLVEPSPDPALTALYNRGDGSFKSADDGNFHVGLVADLNGDGRTDLVGWSSLGAAPLTVEMTQPGGNSSAAESSPSLPFDLIYNSADLAAADVDGDGRPEIVVSVSGATYALVVDGTGNVTSTETLSSTNGLSVAPDLDGDHRAELYSIDGASISITSSRTGNTWTSAISDCIVRALRFADLDGDGNLDLVAAAYARSDGALHAVTFQSNGDGSFTQRVDNVIPDGGLDDIVDIDGDGRPDVAFRTSVGDTEYFAVGDGAFGFKSSSYAVPLPDSNGDIQFAELNGDGRPDIVLSDGAAIYVLDSM